MASDWRAAYEKGLAGLNPWQRAISDRVCDVSKPDWLRVVAAAGAGKTATTTVTLARIANENILPLGAIFATTFTNKAGGELRERLDRMVPPGTSEKMRVGTFHALCTAWLAKNDPQQPSHQWKPDANIDGKDSLWKAGAIGDQIIGDSDAAVPGTKGRYFSNLNVLEMRWIEKKASDGKVRRERKKTFTKDRIPGAYKENTGQKPGLGIKPAYKFPPSWGDYALAIGIFRSRGLTPAEVAAARDRAGRGAPTPGRGAPTTDLERRADATWQDIVRMGGTEVPPVGEPADEPEGLPLLLEVWELFDEAKQGLGVYDFEDILYAYWKRGTDQAALVLVDEAQDDSWLQMSISRQLAERSGGRLVLIGDSRQSIFSWRGASPDIFIKADVELHADTMQIPTNYRSGRDIVEVGNEIADGQDWSVGMPAIPAREDVRNDSVRVKPIGAVRVRRGDETAAQEVTQTAHDVRTLVLGTPLVIDGRSAWTSTEIEAAFQTWKALPENLKSEWTPVRDAQAVLRGWESKRGDAVRIGPEVVDGQATGRSELRLGSTLREIAILCFTNREAHAYSMAMMLAPSVPALVVGADTTFFDTPAAADVLSMCFLSRKISLPVGTMDDRPSRESGFSLLGCVGRTWRKAGRFHGKFFPVTKFKERVTALFNPRGASPSVMSAVVMKALSEILQEQEDRRNPDWEQLERWERDRDEYVGYLQEIESASWPKVAQLAADALLPPVMRSDAEGEVEIDEGEDEGEEGGTSGTDILTLFREIANGYASFEDLLDFAQKLSTKVKAIANPDKDMSVAERKQMEEDFKRRVTISTIHKSKGLEWKHIFLSSTEGVFPRPPFGPTAVLTAEGEQQRLFYVGVTRAKDTCTLTCAEKRQKGARMVEAGPSDFIREYVYPYLRLTEEGLLPWRRVLEDIRSLTPSGYTLTSTKDDYSASTHLLRWEAEGRASVTLRAERGVKDGEPKRLLGWHVVVGAGEPVVDHGRALLPTLEGALRVASSAMGDQLGAVRSISQRFDDFLVFLRNRPGEARPGLSWAQYADWLAQNRDAVLDEFAAALNAGGDMTRVVMGWTSLEELWAEASARAPSVTVKCDPSDGTSGYAVWRNEFLGVIWRLSSGRLAYRGSLALEKPAGRDLLGYGRLEFTRGCVDNPEWPVAVYTVWPDRPSTTYTIRPKVQVYVDGTPEFATALADYAKSIQPPEGPVCTAPECKPPPVSEDVEPVPVGGTSTVGVGLPFEAPPGWSLRWQAPAGAGEAWWWMRDDWYWLMKPEGGFLAVEIMVTVVRDRSEGWHVQILPREFFAIDEHFADRDSAVAAALDLMQKYPAGSPVPGGRGRLFTSLTVDEAARQASAGAGSVATPPPASPPLASVVVEPPVPVTNAPEASTPGGFGPITTSSYPAASAMNVMDITSKDALKQLVEVNGWSFFSFTPWQTGGAWVHESGASISALLVLFENKTPLYEMRRNFRLAGEPPTVWVQAFAGPGGVADVARRWVASFGTDSAPLSESTLATASPTEEISEMGPPPAMPAEPTGPSSTLPAEPRPPVWISVPVAKPTRGFSAGVLVTAPAATVRFVTRGYQGWAKIPKSLVRSRAIVMFDDEATSGTEFTYVEIGGDGALLPLVRTWVSPQIDRSADEARVQQALARLFATDPLAELLRERGIDATSSEGLLARKLYEGSGGRPLRVGGTIWTQATDLVAVGADTDREGKFVDRTVVRHLRAVGSGDQRDLVTLVHRGVLDDLGDEVYAFPGDSHELVTSRNTSAKRS